MTIRRRIAAVFIALATMLGLVTGFAETASAAPRIQTYDGVIRPCGWQDGSNGWYNTTYGAVNCTIQNNHIVVDLYGPQGQYFQGALDIWYDVNQCGLIDFVDGTLVNYTGRFQIKMQNGYSTTSQCAPVGSDVVRYWQNGMGQERTTGGPYNNGFSSERQDTNMTLAYYGAGTRANYLTAYNGCEGNTNPWYGSVVSRARGTNGQMSGTAGVRLWKNTTYVQCAKSSYPAVAELWFSV